MQPDDRLLVIRQFSADEWPVYREMRLKALSSDPGVFCSSYEKESADPDQRWKDGVSDPDVGIFGVFYDGRLVGMTGVAVRKKDESGTTAVLWGSWLEKEWRGRGFSKKMYEARLDWVRQRPRLERVVVSHRESNVASKKANQKHGFVLTHTEARVWPDGMSEPEPCYELKLG